MCIIVWHLYILLCDYQPSPVSFSYHFLTKTLRECSSLAPLPRPNPSSLGIVSLHDRASSSAPTNRMVFHPHFNWSDIWARLLWPGAPLWLVGVLFSLMRSCQIWTALAIGYPRASRSGSETEGLFCFFILPAADDAHPGHPWCKVPVEPHLPSLESSCSPFSTVRASLQPCQCSMNTLSICSACVW